MKKRYVYYIGLLVLMLVMMAACGDEEKSEKQTEEKPTDVEITKDEKIARDKVVATVNDEEILGEDYNSFYIQTKMKMHQFGEDIEEQDAVKEATLEELIAHTLLQQEAKSKGIEVTEEEIETEFKQVKSENEEQLTDYLTEFDLTEDAFKEQMKYSLVLNEYLTKELPASDISDEEAKVLYEELTADEKEAPEFADVKGVLKEQIAQKNQQEALQERLESLKKEATIEKKI